MPLREPLQDGSAAAGEPHANKATIVPAVLFAHQATPHRAFDEADDGMVLLLEELGQFGDRGPAASRVPGHPEHQLVLLRGNVRGAGSAFAESDESAELVAKPREAAKSAVVTRRRRRPAALPFHEAGLYHNARYLFFTRPPLAASAANARRALHFEVARCRVTVNWQGDMEIQA